MARSTSSGSRPQSSTGVDRERAQRVDRAAGGAADGARRQRDHVGEALGRARHHATCCRAGTWRMLGHEYSWSITSLVVVVGANPSTSRARRGSASRPRWSISSTWSGMRRAAEVRDPAGEAPLGPDDRHRDATATADRLAHGDRAGRDDVERFGQPHAGGGHERLGRVVLVDHGERRVGEGAERHGRQPQEPPERAGHVRPEHRRQPDGADRHADPTPDRRRRCARCRRAIRPYSLVGSTGARSSGRVIEPRRRP